MDNAIKIGNCNNIWQINRPSGSRHTGCKAHHFLLFLHRIFLLRILLLISSIFGFNTRILAEDMYVFQVAG